MCLVEDTSKTTEVGPAWRGATGQKGLAQAAQEAEHFLPAQGSQALGQGKRWKPKGTEAVFGSSRELGPGQSPTQAEGLSSRGLSGTLLLSAFWLINQTGLAPFLPWGSRWASSVRSSDWEGGGAQPPDLQASARLQSG